MKFAARFCSSIFLCLLLFSIAVAQKSDIRIEKNALSGVATPGQLFRVLLTGVKSSDMVPLPTDRFEVWVTQDGAGHPAPVRSVGLTMVGQGPPSSSEQMDAMKPVQAVLFMIPQGLHEGEATVVVAYRGQRSDEIKLKIVSRPPKPHVTVEIAIGSMSSRPPRRLPSEMKDKARTEIKLERGQEGHIFVDPLIDPDVPDAAVLVTFKQGAFRSEAAATVTRREPIESRRDLMTFSSARYEVTVKTPAGLATGPAEIEVRLRANGQLSDPGTAAIQVTDALTGDNPRDAAPRIINLGQSKVGIGQAVNIFVQDSLRLGPQPEKVVVILEQGSKQVMLKPEVNGAAQPISMDSQNFLMLIARVGEEMTGEVTVKVYNPARGESGMSEGVPLQIAGEVLAPEVGKVTEATGQDIAMLNMMREQAMKAGREFREYDPRYRYVTIRGKGMDYHPHFIRIAFRQNGRSYDLKFGDYSVSIGDRLIVRLPDEIKPGEVTVTIQNKGAGRLSEPVTGTFEVTQPSRQ